MTEQLALEQAGLWANKLPIAAIETSDNGCSIADEADQSNFLRHLCNLLCVSVCNKRQSGSYEPPRQQLSFCLVAWRGAYIAP